MWRRYCLCAIEGYTFEPEGAGAEEEEEELPPPVQEEDVDGMQEIARRKSQAGGVVRIIKVYLPGTNTHSTYMVQRTMKPWQLLAKVQSKQRLPLYNDEYQFKVTEKDQTRLKLLTRIVNMNTDLHALGVTYLELCRRQCAAPTPRDCVRSEGGRRSAQSLPEASGAAQQRQRPESLT